MQRKFFLLLAIFLYQLTTVNGQNKAANWCGFDEKLKAQLDNNPLLQQQFAQWKENVRTSVGQMELEKSPAGALQIVPVVVHVIHDNGIGNISEGQIKDGIRVLNEDFSRINADSANTRAIFKPHAGVADFEFRLAQKDPSGNPTNGIVRISSPLTYNADDSAKSVSYWNSSKYFNIWLVNSISGSGGGSVILGYAQFPGWGAWNTYGVIMLHSQFGRFGTSNADGRTATHEIGHCLNLFHTFQSGCGGSNCNSNGDDVCDTPPTANETYSCDFNQNLCSNDMGGQSPYTTNVQDQIENYMSYDACQNMFTNGQITRMKAAINANTQLQNLISPANLSNGGVDVLYDADFYTTRKVLCPNQTIKFNDASYYGQNLWSWTFNGGTPSSSNLKNQDVAYAAPGIYSVSLTVSNGSTVKTKTAANYILVVSPDSNYLPFYESFENTTIPNYRWMTVNPDNDASYFQRVTGTGFSGNACVKLNNTGNIIGNKDELIVGSFDFKNMSAVSVKFKTAYVQKDTSTKDKLVMYVSTNCGTSWAPRYSKIGSALASAPSQTAAFTPSDTTQWKANTATLASSMLVENALVKFVFESDEGNNFYIDDINITGTFNPVPPLKAPANYSTNLPDSIKLDWYSVLGVNMYLHELDTSPNFNSPLLEFGQHNFISNSSDSSDTEHKYSGLLQNRKYYWRVRSVTGTDTSAWSAVWNFTVGTPVGVYPPVTKTVEVNIYPNPNDGTFTVAFLPPLEPGFPSSVKIYNILGELVFTSSTTSLPSRISTHLPPGIYFVKINSEKNSFVKKLMIEK